MWEAAAALPEQLSEALHTAEEALGGLARRQGGGNRAIGAVAAFGLGTGRTACAAAAALGAPDLTVPFWSGHGSALPAFVDAGTLVLAVSPSGDTEETLTAADKAIERGAVVVAVGGAEGGPLARMADDARLPWCPVAPSGRTARAALGATTVPVLVALARAGLRPDCAAAVGAAAAALRRRRDTRRTGCRQRWRVGSAAPSRWCMAPPVPPQWRRSGGRPR
jgi:glucose/mannose-6-phosphate isomerase